MPDLATDTEPETYTETDQANDMLEGAEEIFGVIDRLGIEDKNEPDKKDAKPETKVEDIEDGESDALSDLNGDGKKKEKEPEQKTKVETKPDATTRKFPDAIKSEKARDHFLALEKSRDEASKRADSEASRAKMLEAKVQELESKSGVAAPEVKVLQGQLQELQAKLEKQDKIIAITNLEKSAKFEEGVTIPQNEAVEELRGIARSFKLEGGDLDRILWEPDKYERSRMINKLTDDLDDPVAEEVKNDIKAAVAKHVKAEGVRAQLYENHKGSAEFYEQEKQQEEAKAALKRQEDFKKADAEVTKLVKEKFPELVEDETRWNDLAKKISGVTDFDKLPPKAKAYANFTSFWHKPLVEELRETKKKLAEKESILAARTKAMPGRGTAQVTKPGDEEDEADPLGFVDRLFNS